MVLSIEYCLDAFQITIVVAKVIGEFMYYYYESLRSQLQLT